MTELFRPSRSPGAGKNFNSPVNLYQQSANLIQKSVTKVQCEKTIYVDSENF